jgi:autoinducer 2-degrading protein
MYIVAVNVHVKPENVDDFITAIIKNHEGTRKEPGNVRFDVLQDRDDPNRFFLYEVYQTEEAFKAHQQQDHYLTWRETVQDWMAEKRLGKRYVNLKPSDENFTVG